MLNLGLMSLDGSTLDQAIGAFVPFAAWTVLRATMLLSGVLVLAWGVRRASGRARHALWSVTFAALLLLPALSWLLPGVPVSVPALGAEGSERPVQAEESAERVAGASPEVRDPAAAAKLEAGAREAGAPRVNAGEVGAPVPRDRPFPVREALALLWLAGALTGCSTLLLGLRRAGRAAREGSPVEGPAWRRALAEARDALGISRPVALRMSAAVANPMAGGLARRVVLLPESAHSWSEERRRIVLLHELVHIRRADPLRQIVSRLAASIFWFHPLVWWAAREAALAREVACDEAVLALGQRPSTYARHLFELAEPARLPLPAIARRGRSDLEKRLVAVLRPQPTQTRRRVATGLAICGALWAIAVAALSPRAQSPRVQSPRVESVAASTPSGPVVATAYPAPHSPVAERHAPALPIPSAAPATASSASTIPALQEPEAERSCWVDGFRGDFSGTFTQTTGTRGRRIYERYGFSDGDRVVQTYLGDLRLCLRSNESVELSEDMSRIESVGAGGWLVLAAEDSRGTQQLELSAGPNGTRRRFVVDGAERAFDANAEEWRDAMLGVIGARWQISRIRGRVSTLRGEISTVRGRESTLRGEISTIRGHVSSLRGQISTVHGHKSALRGEISTIRGRVSSMRGEISSIRGRESSLRGEISSLRGRLDGLESARRATRDDETRARLAVEIDELEDAIADARRRIQEYDAERRVAEVERRIAEYDEAGRIREVERRMGNEGDERVREIEAQIAAYDADARIREVERRIEALDVNGEVARIERLIEAEDADRRIAEIEGRLGAAERRLERAVRTLR